MVRRSERTNPVTTQPAATRVAILSDTHLCNLPEPMVNGQGSLIQLDQSHLLAQTAVECIADTHPAAVLHLGDQASGGDYFGMVAETDYLAEIDFLQSLLGGVDAPAFALPGNHDCPPGNVDYAVNSTAWGKRRGEGTTIDVDDLRLVLVNTEGYSLEQVEAWQEAERARIEAETGAPANGSIGEPIAGFVTDAELARVDEALASAGKRRVVIFSHQLMHEWSGFSPTLWEGMYGVENNQQVLDLARRHGNVKAMIAGHAHRYDVHWDKLGETTCAFVVTPAVIEFPLAWLELKATPNEIALEMHAIPRPELALRAARYGDVGWRAGKREWRKIVLAES